MKRICLVFLMSLLLLSSCKRDSLAGEWSFHKLLETKAEETFTNFSTDYFSSAIIFSADGNFLFVDEGELNPFQFSQGTQMNSKTNVLYGNWKRIKQDSIVHLSILSDKVQKSTFVKVKTTNKDKIRLKFDVSNTRTDLNTLDFLYSKNNSEDISNSKFNFLSTELNSWRISAKKLESFSEINARVQNALQFALTYYKYADNTSGRVRYSFLKPIPMKFASNGIRIEPNDYWDVLFNSEEEAEISYRILRDAIRASPDIPAKVNKSFEIVIFILEEMLSNVQL